MKHLILIVSLFFSLISNAQEINHLDTILTQLNLTKQNCKTHLAVSKVLPNNSKETIVVIPEIVTEEEDGFELNSHILIVNTNTGVIKYKYFESSKTNNWSSDAVRLAEIKIDTAPYFIRENKRAFGIRVYYYNSSQPNPYTQETLSLFVLQNNEIKKVLNNFQTMLFSGETDTECYAEFVKHEKILIITDKQTNGYFDILVKNKITEINRYLDKNGECIDKEKTTIKNTVLKFDTLQYNL